MSCRSRPAVDLTLRSHYQEREQDYLQRFRRTIQPARRPCFWCHPELVRRRRRREGPYAALALSGTQAGLCSALPPDDPPSPAFCVLGSPRQVRKPVQPSHPVWIRHACNESDTPVWVGHSCPTPLTFVISKNREPSRLSPIFRSPSPNSVIPTAADHRKRWYAKWTTLVLLQP